MRREFLTVILPRDVGSDVLRRIDGKIYVSSALGRVQARDVGKRVYRVDGVIQVENDEQMQARVGRLPSETE